MQISKDIIFVGVNDTKDEIFEGQYPVSGMSYNSYVILDDKIAILDTMDCKFTQQWLDNVDKALNGKKPDYLVIHHLEPDHAYGVGEIVKRYPDITIVGNDKIFVMLPQYHQLPDSVHTITVKEGEKLELGKHSLQFLFAPMVHWPEVMVSYDAYAKVLFSADGFGKFGSMTDNEWTDEAARYYFNIVGKYGAQVQLLLKKVSQLEINTICPLHGPVLSKDIAKYVGLYDTWSKYQVDKEGVLVVYCSMHGNTRNAALYITECLRQKTNVKAVDLGQTDMSYVLADAFRFGKIVLCAPSYNASVMPPMEDLLHHLKGKNYCNKKIAIVENGSWAPSSANTIKSILECMKNIDIVGTVTVRGAVKDADKSALCELADKIMQG